MLRKTVTAVALLASTTAWGVDSFSCVVDAMNGYLYDEATKSYKRSAFVSGREYLISRPADAYEARHGKWLVTEAGQTRPLAWCRNDFNPFGVLKCSGEIWELVFSRTTSRFVILEIGGLLGDWEDTPKGKGAAYIAIGRCTASS